MINFEGGASGFEIVADEIIGVPFGGIVDFDGEVAEEAPVTAEDFGGVGFETFEEFGGSGGAGGDAGPGDVGFEREIERFRETRVGELVGFFLETEEDLRRAHGAEAVPVPIEFGKRGHV